MQLYLLPEVLPILTLTHLFSLFHSLVGIFPHASPHTYPPILSFSPSSRYFPKYFLRPSFTLTHLFTLFLLLVGIFPHACPHSYPPIYSFSTSSGYISSCLSSYLPTYSLFFPFQSVNFLIPVLILTHLFTLFYKVILNYVQ